MAATGPAEPTAQPSTVDLPLTDAHRAAIRRAIASGRRSFLGILTFVATLGLAFVSTFGGVVLGLVVAGAVMTFAAIVDRFFWRGPARRDLQRGTFRRVSGPIDIEVRSRECTVRVGPTRLTLYDTAVGSQLRALPWGLLDYAPGSRVVFEQRTADSEVIFRSPHYRPDDGSAAVVDRSLPLLLARVAAITAASTFCLIWAVLGYWNVSSGGEFRSVAFAPDGSLVAAGTGGGVIQVWRTADGAPVGHLTAARPATWPFSRQRTEVDALRFGTDGATLTAVTGASLTDWRLADRAPVASAELSRPLIGSYWRYGTAISPDGALAGVATVDQTIELVRLTDGVRVWSHPIETPVNALAWSEGDDPQIAVGLRSATIQVLRAHDGGLVRELRGHVAPTSGRSSNDGVQALAFSPDASTLGSVADDGSVRLWQPTEGTGRVLFQGRNELTSIAWSPDGRIVAAGASEGNVVRAWQVADGAQLYEARGHRDWVVALAFSTDGGVLASASRDGTIRLVRAADGTALATLRLPD